MSLQIGLRARVAVNLAAAVSITCALLALSSVVIVRDEARLIVRDAAARVERLDLDAPLLMEEGDEIGRMAGTVRRMVERLRDDKLRKEAYIAELEQANRALTETREGLARSERLATVGRLAAGVAHEIG